MRPYALRDIHIDGFRGLRGLSLESLGLVNILVGENNSGKTSVLEAVSILCQPLDPWEWLDMVRRRDFGSLDESRLQSLRWCFSQSGRHADPDSLQEGHCRLSCSGEFTVHLSAHYAEIMGEPSPDELQRAMRLGRIRESQPEETQWRGAQLSHDVVVGAPDAAVPVPVKPLVVWEDMPILSRFGHSRIRRREHALANQTLTPYSYQINSLQVRSQSRQAIAPEHSDAIINLVRNFDPDVLAINVASFRGVRPAISIVHKKLGAAPLSVFGDALRRAVLLANTIYSLKDNGVLLIDELETGIHVSALKPVFAWLISTARELGVQVIATTHSLEAVDGILEGAPSPSDIVTYHLSQADSGTHVKRIPGELAKRLREERGLDVR